MQKHTPTFRPLRFASRLVFGLLVVVVAGLLSEPAHAQTSYLVKPDGPGNNLTTHLRTIVDNPIYNGELNTAPAYIPSQYLIFSKDPSVQFDIKGGRWRAFGTSEPNGVLCYYQGLGCDWNDLSQSPRKTDSYTPDHTNGKFVYEVYQLKDMSAGDGAQGGTAGKRLGDPLDSTLASIFPQINRGPSNDNWQGFSYGGDSNVTFNSATYPQFNGYYVFMIKVVHDEDLGKGYVPFFNPGLIQYHPPDGNRHPGHRPDDNWREAGCLNMEPLVTCPRRWRQEVGRDSLRVAQNAYYLRAHGGDVINTAPTNIASAFRFDNPEGNADSTIKGLKVNTAGFECNQYGRAGYWWMRSLWNVDWDRGAEDGLGGGAEGQSPQLQADFGFNNNFYRADRRYYDYVYPNGKRAVAVSNGWSGGGKLMYLPDNPANTSRVSVWDYVTGTYQETWKPSSHIPPGGSRDLKIQNVKATNNLYLGNLMLGDDKPPGCTTSDSVQVRLFTPKGDGRDVASANNYYPFTNPGKNNAATYNHVYNGHEIANQTNLWFQEQLQSFNNRPSIKVASRFNSGNWEPGGWQPTAQWFGFTYANRQSEQSRADLAAPGPHRWEVCATESGWTDQPGGPDNAYWNCAIHDYYVNSAPTVTNLAPPDQSRHNNNCISSDFLRFRLNDPENHPVQGKVNVSWSGVGGAGSQTSNVSRVKSSGAEYTSSELTMSDGRSLSQFISAIPEGSNVLWHAIPSDVFGASDTNNTDYFGTANRANVRDNTGKNLSQPAVGYKQGPAGPTWRFYKKIRPNFNIRLDAQGRDVGSKKKIYQTVGEGEVENVSDGQTVRVETTIKNTGETPAKNYELKDYVGPVRDFERPTNISIQFNGNAQALPADALKIVRNRNKADPNDERPPSGDGDELITTPENEQKIPGTAWRIELAKSGDPNSVLAKVGATELKPGESVKLAYFVRANRNRNNNPQPDQTRGDYNRSLTINPKHFYVAFQPDYCDPASREYPPVLDGVQPTVDAPFVRGQRGSVGTNSGINAYKQSGATYLVTAAGDIFNFGNDSTDAISKYRGSNPCEADPASSRRNGIDWRREMFKNVNGLLNDKTRHAGNNSLTALQSSGNLSQGPNKNVWVVDGPTTLEMAQELKGVGTVIVKGNLTVKGQMKYAKSGINSLGVIVLGKLTIEPAAGIERQDIVGSYYVLDSRVSNGLLQPSPTAADCPRYDGDIGEAGVIDTVNNPQQLAVDGLMVARQFKLQRTYTKPSARGGDAANAAAEYVYYDGRVVAATPPGLSTFRATTSWYEVAP